MHKLVYKFKIVKIMNGLKNYKVKKYINKVLICLGLSIMIVVLFIDSNSIKDYMIYISGYIYGILAIILVALINWGYKYGYYYD